MTENALYGVQVEFVLDDTDEVYARATIPANQLVALPEVASQGTVISLGQLEWVVTSAMPLRRSEAAVWGVWRIRGSAGQAPPPPTISEIDSARGEGDVPEGSLVIPPHAWRQLEVLSPELGDAVDQEVELVKDALRNGQAAWPHVRDIVGPCRPFAFDAERLMSVLGVARAFPGVSIGHLDEDTEPDLLVGGFAFVTDEGTLFYGVSGDDEIVEILGILDTNREDRGAFQRDLAVLQDDVLQSDDMILIPWLTVRPDEDD